MSFYFSFCLILVLAFISSCKSPTLSQTAINSQPSASPATKNTPTNTNNQNVLNSERLNSPEFVPDSEYLTFGKIFRTEPPKSFSFNNPHQVAQQAFFSCSQGQTKQLLTEMGHVESDADLGKAFLTFLDVFCPDIERFKNKEIYLKFHGYFVNEPTTVWYYYLTDEKGKHIEHDSWISVHRSRSNGQCALTGIFLYESESGTPSMPKNLITSKDEIK